MTITKQQNGSALCVAIEGRLDQISRLQRKYGKTEEEILSFLSRAKSFGPITEQLRKPTCSHS